MDNNTSNTATTPATITLVKGQKLSLSKTLPGFTKILVGLGWNPRVTSGVEFDLDAVAFLVKEDGKVRNDDDFVFYNAMSHTSGSVIQNGDNRTGAGDGDDETISVDLTKVPADVQKIVIGVSIFNATKRAQNFGQVDGAYVRLVEPDTGKEVSRYDLSEDASTVTAMIFARFYRKDGGWSMEAVGQGFDGGLQRLCSEHGITVPAE
ncbi:TerD family protein [bacterium]|nr:TerD family protein [bacterium]MBP9810435.1 TerD family protein [bacterium]